MRAKQRLSIHSADYLISISDQLIYDADVSAYVGYSIRPMMLLARAILTSALARRETRGAHLRLDHPQSCEEYACCTICEYQNGEHCISFEPED